MINPASFADAVGLATAHYHTVDNGIVALSRSLIAAVHSDVLPKALQLKTGAEAGVIFPLVALHNLLGNIGRYQAMINERPLPGGCRTRANGRSWVEH